ncbi:hypothetical protein AWM75_03920 [Aerococcus urinaehominis]|uniref:Uncharacterized protein n=1 Tax=Aerococcus urinaehominis TaxID=128944 RepID=A0A120IAU9_9LACT|nr:SMI1/KNR4 family protein [Aerococcus urinaehominis]AMB99203.1 hypothetical protein AWM75_03920 [Aerococcus urinaehominis]SDM32498.1 hypothetical protein SAMN04487985_11254 [Aerococcus urinaehominis]
MHLIALPFQKQSYTYLPASPIYRDLAVDDLPISYHNLVNQQNGGYTSKSYYPTHEPTSDALSAVYIPYIAGLSPQKNRAAYEVPSILYQDQFTHRQHVPDHTLIIYEDGPRVVYLDYDKALTPQEPAVCYIDTETDQWLDLASCFSDFIQNFEHRYFELPAPPMRTFHRANAAFLHAQTSQQLAALWEEFEDSPHKEWYFKWLNYYSQVNDPSLIVTSYRAMQHQEEYFRRYLPDNYPQVKANFESNLSN